MQKMKCSLSNTYARLNIYQRRDTWLNGTGFTQFYLPPTRLSTNGMSHSAFILKTFSRWRRPSKVVHIWISLLLIYRPRKDERLSGPSWLTYSVRLTAYPHKWSPIGYRSSVGPGKFAGKDRRSTAVPWKPTK